MMKHLYSIGHFSKGTIQFLLSLFLLTNGLHIDDHNHSAAEGYSICNPECDSSDHHSSENNCEECVNNSNKQTLFLKAQSYSLSHKSNFILQDYCNSFNNDINYHYFGSRAPPSFL